jgi:hypothetical protein
LSHSIQIIDPTRFPSWDSMLFRTPGATFFHGSAWARVLSESYGYTPLYFSVIDGEKLHALVPMMEVNSFLTGKRGVSLPFTDYCDPLIDKSVESPDRAEMFHKIVGFGKKRGWKYIELRFGGEYLRNQDSAPSTQDSGRPSLLPAPCSPLPASMSGVLLAPRSSFLAPVPAPSPFVTYLGHTMDLARGEKVLQAALRDSTRRNIRKAAARGLDVRITHDLEGIREFYRLHCLTRKLHGLPPQPFSFFKKIHERVISTGQGFVVLASRGGKNIAGSVFFYFGERALFKYGASDRKYQDLRANNLVMWEAVKWFAERGFKTLCLGRTDMENEGLRQFKNGWGAGENQIQYFKYDLRQDAFIAARPKGKPAYTSLFRATPIPVLNVIGSLVYRHIG